MKREHCCGYGALFFLLFCIDRITKYLITAYEIKVYRVTPFLTFDLAFNRGVSWGMLSSSETLPFVGVTVVVSSVIALLIRHTLQQVRYGIPVIGEVMVLAGATSNIVDRFVYGGVIDFIRLCAGQYCWPSFNVADSCIVLGVMIMIITMYRKV